MRPEASGGGHPLHAVHAALEAELGVDAVALDHGDDFLDAALAGAGHGHHVDLPALALRVALVHAEDLGGEEGRLLAARPCPDLQQHVLLVVGILGDEQRRDLGVQRVAPRFESAQLLMGHLAHVGVRLRPDHLLDLGQLAERRLVGAVAVHDGGDLPRLARQLLVGGRVPRHVGIGHLRLDLGEPGLDVLQLFERYRVHRLLPRPERGNPGSGREGAGCRGGTAGPARAGPGRPAPSSFPNLRL
jgi:hypothetical protein